MLAVGRGGRLRGVGDDRAAGSHRNAGKPGARGVLDRPWTDRGQIETAILIGLRRFDQNADAGWRGHAPLPAQFGDAQQQIVGAFRRLDGEHVVVGDDRGLPYVERSERGDQSEGACDIGAVALRRLIVAKHALRNHDFRRDLVDADDAQAGVGGHARHPG